MSIWNKETERILETMWREGKSDEIIARHLSVVTGKPVSRNTCMGKRHRMKLVHDQPASPGARKRKPRKRAAVADGAVQRRLRAGKREPYQPPMRLPVARR